MNNTDARREKGKEIASRHDLIRVSDYHYKVHSQTSNRDYDVIKVGDKWQCNCADSVYRHVCCKHSHAVEFSIKIREEVRERNKVVIAPINVSSCIYCHSNNVTKDGLRHNKYGN